MQVTISAAAVWAFVGSMLGMIIALGTAWALVGRPLRDLIRQWRLMVEDWNGVEDRPGVPGRAGVMLRFEQQDTRMSAVEAQLRTNGGTTLRDVVMQTQRTLMTLVAQVGIPYPDLPGGSPPAAVVVVTPNGTATTHRAIAEDEGARL